MSEADELSADLWSLPTGELFTINNILLYMQQF